MSQVINHIFMIVFNYNFLFLLSVILIALPFLCQFNNRLSNLPFAFSKPKHYINQIKQYNYEKDIINHSICVASIF